MRIKAYGFKLTSADRILIEKMMKLVSSEEVEIIDLHTYIPPEPSSTVIIAYGQRADTFTIDLEWKHRITLPHPNKLDSKTGFKKLREKALVQILQLKEDLKEQPATKKKKNKRIKTKELPSELTATNIKILERQQLEQGIDSWFGKTEDNKTIKVTSLPEQDSADINITFAELYAITSLSESFKVKELEIVYKPNINKKDNSR